MKPLKPFLLLASCLCAIQSAPADTVVLKNGEKIEGKVVREDDVNYVVEVKVTNTIRDEKKIPKADVESIVKVSEDMKDFAKIEGFVPTPELLDVAGYESRIAGIEAFIKDHPDSGKASKAKEMLVVLKEELETVRAGGIKFGEEMVSAEDYLANAYEYDAMIAAIRIKEAVGRRDLLSALRLFTEYDRNFADAAGRADTVSLIRQVLAAYITNIDESLASIDTRLEKRTSGLAQMSVEDRTNTERALKEQQDRIEQRFAGEKESKETWVTPDAFHKESLDEARRQADGEMKRLEAPPTQNSIEVPMEETYRVAWGNLSGGTDEEKKTMIAGLKTARMPDKYIALLTERAGLEAEQE